MYRPGKHQLAADAMSRKPDSPTDRDPADGDESLFVIEDHKLTFESLRGYRDELLEKGRDPSKVGSGNFKFVNRQMVRVNPDKPEDRAVAVLCTEEEARITIQAVHVNLGHRNYKDVLDRMKNEFWFPSMSSLIEDTIKSCIPCQIHAPATSKQDLPIQVIERGGPFKKWGMDFVGPLPRTSQGNEFFITAIDYGTGWAYAVPLKRISKEAAINLVKQICLAHGQPEEITTDNGREFHSNLFQAFLGNCGIRHINTTPYHPQGNGLVERFHQTLITSLKKFCSPYNQDGWDQFINKALFAYRASHSTSFKTSPFEMTYGTKARITTPLSISNSPMVLSKKAIELIQQARRADLSKISERRQFRINELNDRA